MFLVTYGQSQGNHIFDEGISPEGLLRWQSQPRQRLVDSGIQQLIHHDDARHSVHLFLRTTERPDGTPRPYTYLGRLKYIDHDHERKQPVHFLWQLLAWAIPPEVVGRIGLRLDEADSSRPPLVSRRLSPGNLALEPPPLRRDESEGATTRQFQAMQLRRVSEEENSALGRAGELLVLDHERQHLRDVGRADLAERIVHVSNYRGRWCRIRRHPLFPGNPTAPR